MKRLFSVFSISLLYFHLAAITSRSLPEPEPSLKLGIAVQSREAILDNLPAWFLYYNQIYVRPLLFERYLSVMGFEQNWNMFAPNPIQQDIWIDAIVSYSDGTNAIFEYPRNSTMSQKERFLQERFSKFIITVQDEQRGFLWPSLADYVARRSDVDSKRIPVGVSLRRWTYSPDFTDPSTTKPAEPFTFFETPILPERIRP